MTSNLYRSRTHRIVGGVCGGLGEYFDLDPVLVRIVTLILFTLPGIGILTYILAWIIIPDQPYELAEAESTREFSPWNRYIPGILLIGLGVVLLARSYLWFFDWAGFWSIVLILGGVGLIFYSIRQRARANLPDLEQPYTNGTKGGPVA